MTLPGPDVADPGGADPGGADPGSADPGGAGRGGARSGGTGALPRVVPIFPLRGVLLLPRGRLPLNVFEPRYLNLTGDALAAGRLIGMIQPQDAGEGEAPPIFRTGCLGRIVAFSETEDNRFLLTLEGICRFDVLEELPLVKGYRRVVADYGPYAGDLTPPEDVGLDRDRLLIALKVYFQAQGISADWGQVESAPDERLVTTLAMVCPFSPTEKQALLECRDPVERASVLTALVEMAAMNRGDDTAEPSRH